jgi:hypothetical protein
MRQNIIMEMIDTNKDNNKVDGNAVRDEADATMYNQSVEQNTRETRDLMHVINRIQLEIASRTSKESTGKCH